MDVSISSSRVIDLASGSTLQPRGRRGEIHPVMLVERRRVGVADPRSVHVSLVGQDQGGRDRVHGFADVALVLMGTDRAHDDRRVFRRRAKSAQDPMREQCAWCERDRGD